MKQESKNWTTRHRWQFLLVLIIVTTMSLLAFLLLGQLTRPTSTVIAPTPTATAVVPGYTEVNVDFGRGFLGNGWQVYFNAPDSSRDPSTYHGGIDTPLVKAIDELKRSLDIAAFELNNEVIFQAILAAFQRGVALRIVTDDEYGLEDETYSFLRDLLAAGLAIVDDQRSGLMHNKFMILDSETVWTGSWNYTVNGTYRNNNNVLVIKHPAAVAAYQAEFDEMFERGEFGTRSSDDGVVTFAQVNGEISIVFAAEADEIEAADSAIRIMTFVFSLEELADAILEKMTDPDFVVQGVFEERNSKASWSQMPTLHCAGAQMRQDGNRYILHHKVLIIDDDTVITGSFNYSKNAAQNNDENIVIIRNRAIAGLYLDEWQRIWDSAENLAAGEVDCA